MNVKTLSTLTIALLLLTAGAAAATGPPTPDPDDAPKPGSGDVVTEDTADNATSLANYTRDGVNNAGDFDGDGHGADDLAPGAWATDEVNHTVDAVASGNASRVLDAATNGTCLSPCDELGDLDGDGDSGWDEATAVLDYVQDDVIHTKDDEDGSLQNETKILVQNATGVNETEPRNGSIFTDGNATATNLDTWARSFSAWTGAAIEADYDWANASSRNLGGALNWTVHDLVNNYTIAIVNGQLDAYCGWTGPAADTCSDLEQDPVSLTGPDHYLGEAFRQADALVMDQVFQTLQDPPSV